MDLTLMLKQFRVPCATLENVATSIIQTSMSIRSEPEHTILEARPVRHIKKPYCRWVVRFSSHNGDYTGRKNAEDNYRKLPGVVFSEKLNQARCESPPSWIVTFGVN